MKRLIEELGIWAGLAIFTVLAIAFCVASMVSRWLHGKCPDKYCAGYLRDAGSYVRPDGSGRDDTKQCIACGQTVTVFRSIQQIEAETREFLKAVTGSSSSFT